METAQSLLIQIYPIEQAIDELLQSDSYTGAARSLLRLLQEVVAHLRTALEGAPGVDEQRLEQITERFYLAQEVLTYIQGSEGSREPQLVTRAMHRAFLPAVELPVLLHTNPFHSRFSRGDLASMLTMLCDGLTTCSVPASFPTIAFPATEHENTLVYAVLAYEFGYLLQQRLPAASLTTLPTAECVPLEWRETLLADAWATRLTGPAYAFASSILYPMMEDPTPFAAAEPVPLDLRMQCMYEQLLTYGYGHDGETGVMTHLQRMALPEEWMAYAHEIARLIAMADGPAPFTVERYTATVPPLLTRLYHLVPPNEMETPVGMQIAEVAAMLNAGWAMVLTEWEEFTRRFNVQTTLDDYRARQLISRLVLKGIELSLIAAEWEGES